MKTVMLRYIEEMQELEEKMQKEVHDKPYQEMKMEQETLQRVIADLKQVLNNDGDSFTYTVFVGGGEVNDYWLEEEQANDIAKEWKDKGYDDVLIIDLMEA
jgi:hypothetical protein